MEEDFIIQLSLPRLWFNNPCAVHETITAALATTPLVAGLPAEMKNPRPPSWKCKKCGACCEILFPMLFGTTCRHYDDKKRLCKIYNQRPEICRVKHHLGEGVTIKLCNILRDIKDEIPDG